MRSIISKTGFTLIELLVVISILALLAAMLLPAIAGAQRTARQTADLNNAKQLLTTIVGYRNDHGGTWPQPPFLTITDNVPAPSDVAETTAMSFYHLAGMMDVAPGSFNSPAAAADAVTKAAEDSSTLDSDPGCMDWSGGDGTDYALDWAARKSAGSVRVVIASRDPSIFGTDETNVVFADGHTEKFAYEDGAADDSSPLNWTIENPALDDMIYTNTDDSTNDNTKWARGDTKRAWVK